MTAQAAKPEAMIFDLDGTLFQAETLMIPAYHAAFQEMREEGTFKHETPPEERLLGGLGMLLSQIWQRVMPEEPEEVHLRANDLLLKHQLLYLEQGEGLLYEGVEETLRALKDDGIRLFVASNGMEDYVKLVTHHKEIASLFEGLYSAGEYQTASKVDLVRILMDKHGIRSAWMVGDRSSDVEAGKKNGLFVVGCDYATFGKQGELEGSDTVIRDFREIRKLYA
ncbi:MTA/SAH nucleosidase [Paenibacillus sp. J31TS4]|uniref:HAD family hydrolase n=1 Tax=Paenibacillus sp. J31TS4 TaxID=2807195 RepID=UPI001B01DF5F|nr:HAD hydrolase-like protein [Paenibacillus sp. J31TS4]GIP38268.1 MTA/SAH nucleosidase [Paenibacillus sp. J31TS4]